MWKFLPVIGINVKVGAVRAADAAFWAILILAVVAKPLKTLAIFIRLTAGHACTYIFGDTLGGFPAVIAHAVNGTTVSAICAAYAALGTVLILTVVAKTLKTLAIFIRLTAGIASSHAFRVRCVEALGTGKFSVWKISTGSGHGMAEITFLRYRLQHFSVKIVAA